jgi:phenylalanyl-tRNA synthetase beta subunit
MSRVARYHADRTNQKLYFARLACQQAEQVEHIQQAQAHREATVFHLHGAVLAFLQELVRYYRLNDFNPTLKSVEEHMATKGQVSPEISVMQKLAKEGFIAELKRAYRMCQYAPEPSAPEPEAETSSNLIIKVTQSPQAWLPTLSPVDDQHL